MDLVLAIYHRDQDSYWAESPDAPEWTAAASSIDELRPLIEDGLRFALGHDGILIQHYLDACLLNMGDLWLAP